MSTARHHAEWLSLVEVSGPFVSLPVLMRVFPQGLVAHDPDLHRNLRLAHEEWEDNQEGHRPDRAIHQAWMKFVLREVLGFADEVIAEGQGIQQTLQTTIPEHNETLRPDLVIVNPPGRKDAGKARLLVRVYPASQDLEHPVAGQTWKASPDTRMMELLHNTNVRMGLVTNGEQWMLVDAPRNETTGYASWYASLWLEEPITIRAFRSLLGMERFFGVQDSDILEALLAESAQNQQEVTNQLGYQVRRAVEVLIQSLDQADQDHGRELLGSIPETDLYEAALTVMMRLVFLFCAEERGLMLLDDEVYADNYAVSTLQAQLRETADQHGEEILERRHDAWSRLLSTFRAVFGGIEHDRLKMPAYGGRLFNPDRFAFLEGRKQGTTWKDMPADPLPVNNRTVLHLLEALQYLQVKVPGGGQAESRRLSFRALDIEQIGHVYEGLLDHTAKRAAEPILGLAGTKDKEPEVPLAELEKLKAKGEAKLLEFLHDETGKSKSALKKALAAELDVERASQFQAACGNDANLWARLKLFGGLVRNDTFGHPVVIAKGSIYVTEGTDRRSSGTHYTPTSLTEPIVRYTLEPLVYVGPAEGKPNEEWTLRSPKELLDLKICDMACGSGAFLVQACRYMAERLVEAWEETNKLHPEWPGITPFGEDSRGKPGEMLIPKDTAERMIYARRLVAQRCLYGVDKNPLAADMAKLSLWLLTLQKDKPFTFLDHAIRSGDSLVGIANTHQLTSFSLDGNGPDMPMFTDAIKKRLDAVRLLRRQIAELADNSAEDVERKSLMLQNAEQQTQRLAYAANFLLAACWESTSETDRDERLKQALVHVEFGFKDLPVEELATEGKQRLQEAGCPKPFHWSLEFPEVFMQRGGFDAFVGNPPFMGGQKITGSVGDTYREYLVKWLASGKRGSADLCAYFFLRAKEMLRQGGQFGLLATNTIAQGDTREVGLEQLTANGCTIPRAVSSRKWPGMATVEVAHVWVRRGEWQGTFVLNEHPANAITALLSPLGKVAGPPYRLHGNSQRAFKGSTVLGMGFIVEPDEAARLISEAPLNRGVLFPYLIGEDINSMPDQSATRWVVNFGRMSEDEARKYPCFTILKDRVYQYRQSLASRNQFGVVRAEKWWQFDRPTDALYAAVARFERVIVCAQTSRLWEPVFVSTKQVFSHMTIVFALPFHFQFAVIQSSLHEFWRLEYGPSLRTDARYTTTDCFEPFPFPEGLLAARPSTFVELDAAGDIYHEHRRQIMLARQEGLTKTYNRFHNPDETADDIQKLRDLHVETDNAVAAAYGWSDLDLGHGFHETKQGLRFTISEPARREVLARLLTLNHERYAEEVAKGLHEKKKGGKDKGGGGMRRGRRTAEGPGLFD